MEGLNINEMEGNGRTNADHLTPEELLDYCLIGKL
ncbi:hypothetical protein A2U01_0102818, partial [Trifolium medium]|nr:hypothetical protein [Trifolium medium]